MRKSETLHPPLEGKGEGGVGSAAEGLARPGDYVSRRASPEAGIQMSLLSSAEAAGDLWRPGGGGA